MIWELAAALVGAGLAGWGYAPLWRPVAPARWRESRVDMMERQLLYGQATLPVTGEETSCGPPTIGVVMSEADRVRAGVEFKVAVDGAGRVVWWARRIG